jgi:hypothetical protein
MGDTDARPKTKPQNGLRLQESPGLHSAKKTSAADRFWDNLEWTLCAVAPGAGEVGAFMDEIHSRRKINRLVSQLLAAATALPKTETDDLTVTLSRMSFRRDRSLVISIIPDVLTDAEERPPHWI